MNIRCVRLICRVFDRKWRKPMSAYVGASDERPTYPFHHRSGRPVGRRAAALTLVLSLLWSLQCFSQEKPAMLERMDDPAVTNAIEKARHGSPDDLLYIARVVSKQPKLLPAAKPLTEYHNLLKDENVFIQCFAAQMVAKYRNMSSIDVLQHFILDLQDKRSGSSKVSQTEMMALVFAEMTALAALADIGDDKPLTVRFLANRLEDDQQMEWGGGLAHDALAEKGRPGLLALLAKATEPTEYTNKEEFLAHALLKIKDPVLAPDLYACCRDPKYTFKVRHAALWAISEMAMTRTNLTQMVIALAEDKKSDLRDTAVYRLGAINNPQAREVLLKLETGLKAAGGSETNMAKDGIVGDQKQSVDKALESALLKSDTNRVTAIVNSILASTTQPKEKMDLWDMIEPFIVQQEQLRQCLQVSDGDGRPINALRVKAWMKLGAVTTVELEYDNIDQLREIAAPIFRMMEYRARERLGGEWTKEKADQMVLDDTLKFIRKWRDPRCEVAP